MRSEKRGLIISFQYFVLAIGRVAGLAIATGFALTLAPCSVHAQEFFPSGVGTETDIFGAAGSNAGGCPPGQNYGSYVSTTGPVLQGGDGVRDPRGRSALGGEGNEHTGHAISVAPTRQPDIGVSVQT